MSFGICDESHPIYNHYIGEKTAGYGFLTDDNKYFVNGKTLYWSKKCEIGIGDAIELRYKKAYYLEMFVNGSCYGEISLKSLDKPMFFAITMYYRGHTVVVKH